jgi:hypothetical protein
MKEELLSKQPSLQDSADSPPAPPPKTRRESVVAFFKREDKGEKVEKCQIKTSPKKKSKATKAVLSQALSPRHHKKELSVVPEATTAFMGEPPDFPPSKSDDELLQASEGSEEPLPGPSSSPPPDPEMFYSLPPDHHQRHQRRPSLNDMDSESCEPGFPNSSLLPLLSTTSSSEDNLLSGGGGSGGQSLESKHLPNGMVIISSPNGDIFARSRASTGKDIFVRPKKFAHLKNFTTNLPPSMKQLPLKDNRVKSLNRSRTLEGLECDLKNDIDSVCLEEIRKEDLYMMWKACEHELNDKLSQALSEKAALEEKLATLKPDLDT